MKSGEKMNVPKLRFKEFNDEWITYKFYDLVSIINGQVDPNKKEYCNLPHIDAYIRNITTQKRNFLFLLKNLSNKTINDSGNDDS